MNIIEKTINHERYQLNLPHNKKIIPLGKALLAVSSMGTAHYTGFLTHTPFEILSIVSLEFLPSFVALFAFYISMCYLISRIFSFIFSQLHYSISSILASSALALKRYFPKKLKNFSIHLHKSTPLGEKWIYIGFITFSAPSLFNMIYLKFDQSEISQTVWLALITLITASIVKSGILARPRRQIKRIIDKRRVQLRNRLTRDYIYILAGSALALSFYTGTLRYEKVLNDQPVFIEHKNYKNWAKILIKSGNSYLLVDDSTEPKTFKYLNNDIIISLNDEK